MKKNLTMLLAMAVVVVLFAGCGNSAETSKSTTCKITKIVVKIAVGSVSINWIEIESNGETYILKPSDMFADMTMESGLFPEGSGITGDANGNLILAPGSYFELTVKNGSDVYEMKLGVGMEYSTEKAGDSIKIKFNPAYCFASSE